MSFDNVSSFSVIHGILLDNSNRGVGWLIVGPALEEAVNAGVYRDTLSRSEGGEHLAQAAYRPRESAKPQVKSRKKSET